MNRRTKPPGSPMETRHQPSDADAQSGTDWRISVGRPEIRRMENLVTGRAQPCSHRETGIALTTFFGLPLRNARRFSTTISINRERDARLAQAMCGVIMQLGT